MATDDERREVAAKLRELAAENRGTLGWGRTSDAIVAAKRIMGTCGLESVAHVLERNADLIEPAPERTCRMVFDMVAGMHRCSGCGKALASAAIGMALDEWSYCPACGARVVG